MRLDDGRDLAWFEVGAPRGVPVFVFHGSPGRSFEFSIYDQVARRVKVRLISLDRPGYGHSTYKPRRKLGDFGSDIRQFADHLGVDTFSVLGHSGGGPHALACARFLPERVRRCAVVSGVAPPGRANMTEGMMLTNRMQWVLYSRWPAKLDGLAATLGWLVAPVLAAFLKYGLRHPETRLDGFAKMLPACDAEVVARPEIRAQLVAEAREFSLPTARTAIQDMALCIRPWDFSLADIDVVVDIWHGDRDRNVPLAQGQELARTIPNASLHECVGEGHWLVVDHMEEILIALASST